MFLFVDDVYMYRNFLEFEWKNSREIINVYEE